MEELLNLLGFTTVASSAWNTIAYAAFIAIIVGVFYERHRNALFTIGAAVLVAYAYFFLGNPLFATLQVLIMISGLLRWKKVNRRFSIMAMLMLTALAYAYLYLTGAIMDIWSLAGSLGLLGIAFGLILLPKRYGFLIMAVGGSLLVFYAFHVAAWVFFLLNIFFAISNIYTWKKTGGVSN